MNERFKFGEMDLQIVPGRVGDKVERFELTLQERRLDLCKLPDNHPARMRKGSPLGIKINPKVHGAYYTPGEHRLNFNSQEFYRRTFPLTFFEELHHAEMDDLVNSQLEQMYTISNTDNLPELFRWFPLRVQGLMRQAFSMQPSKELNHDHVSLAFTAAEEYTAKAMAIKSLYAWCDYDIVRAGMTDQMVAEFTLLSLATRARDHWMLVYLDNGLLTYPVTKDFESLRLAIFDRIHVVQNGLSTTNRVSWLSSDNSEKFFQIFKVR